MKVIWNLRLIFPTTALALELCDLIEAFTTTNLVYVTLDAIVRSENISLIEFYAGMDSSYRYSKIAPILLPAIF